MTKTIQDAIDEYVDARGRLKKALMRVSRRIGFSSVPSKERYFTQRKLLSYELKKMDDVLIKMIKYYSK